jgi:hypothetical protein
MLQESLRREVLPIGKTRPARQAPDVAVGIGDPASFADNRSGLRAAGGDSNITADCPISDRELRKRTP